MKRAAAALILFTRIPLWRWVDVPKEAYGSAVVCWPVAGWVTAGATALALLAFGAVVPWTVAVVAALAVRLLLTGALHEDGLADFADGFGGGTSRERILAIMKDSHIGTYGVIALAVEFMMWVAAVSSLPPTTAAAAVFAADPFSKAVAGQITDSLPYARPEGAKNKISYARMSVGDRILTFTAGLAALTPLALTAPQALVAAVCPIIATLVMAAKMKRSIGGYTGDCCGATFLVAELSMLVGMTAALRLLA